MRDVIAETTLSFGAIFPDESNLGKMCKNCFKVYENFSRKCTVLKAKLSDVLSKVCDTIITDIRTVKPLLTDILYNGHLPATDNSNCTNSLCHSHNTKEASLQRTPLCSG